MRKAYYAFLVVLVPVLAGASVRVNYAVAYGPVDAVGAPALSFTLAGGVPAYVVRWPDLSASNGPVVGSGVLEFESVESIGCAGPTNSLTWLTAAPVAGVCNGTINLSLSGPDRAVYAAYVSDPGMELAAGTFFGGMALVGGTVGLLGYARSMARRLTGHWSRMEI